MAGISFPRRMQNLLIKKELKMRVKVFSFLVSSLVK
nr:MAG TPA: hypothetical protein [Caudoviricetes sp.]